MAQYVKCPKCELNYIKDNEQYCMACNPKMRGKSITEIEEENEKFRQTRLEAYERNRKSMQDFRAYRYNCVTKR